MIKKLKNLFYLLFFFTFFILLIIFYFSDQNVIKTNKLRSIYSIELKNYTQNLPILKNDTNNIVEYKNDIEIYEKKKKKYTFWDLIKK